MGQKFSYLSDEEAQEFYSNMKNDSAYAFETEVHLEKAGNFIAQSFPFNIHAHYQNTQILKAELTDFFKQADYFQLKMMLHFFSTNYSFFDNQGNLVVSLENNAHLDKIISTIKSSNFEKFNSTLSDMCSYIEKELFERFSINIKHSLKEMKNKI